MKQKYNKRCTATNRQTATGRLTATTRPMHVMNSYWWPGKSDKCTFMILSRKDNCWA